MLRSAMLFGAKAAVAAGTGWVVSSMVADTINSPTPGYQPVARGKADKISRGDVVDCGACGAIAAVFAVGVFNRLTRRFVS